MNGQYNFSYSGSDVKALIKSTDSNTAYKVLNTLTTVSFSVNEQKTPVRRLGRRHVVGFTKAIRTIAGTMVLTVLKGHPLTELYTVGDYYKAGEMGQGIHRPNSYHFATNVPPFDLKLIYQTEHNSNYYAELEILGIEIISQSIVTSVNDMITECVLQFVARDYKEFINHVSSVTEDKVRENRAKLQLQDIEKRNENDVDNVSEEGITNVVLNHKADPKKKYTLEQINYLLRGANMKSKPKVETVNNNEQLNGLTNAEQNVFEDQTERYNKQDRMGVE